MNRREVLTAGPVAVLAGAGGARASAAADPVLPLYREWYAAKADWTRLAGLQDDANWDHPDPALAAALAAAEARETVAFFALIDMTPTSWAGIAALTDLLWDVEGPCVLRGHPDWAQACADPTRKLILAIWRAASGQTGVPASATIEDTWTPRHSTGSG